MGIVSPKRGANELERKAAENAACAQGLLAVGIVILAALLLVSCGHTPSIPVGDAPAQCYTACTPSLTDTGLRWDADPEDPQAWDALGETVVPAAAWRLLACERSRRACTDFLESLKKRGVYRASP